MNENRKLTSTQVVSKSIIKGINDNYQKSQNAAKSAIEYAIKTGEFLLKAKEQVPHGGWENWIQKGASETSFSTRKHAEKYMRLAKYKELAKVINEEDSSFNLTDLTARISNATEGEKAEAEKLKQELAEQEEAKKQADAEKKKQKEIDRVSRVAEDARSPAIVLVTEATSEPENVEPLKAITLLESQIEVEELKDQLEDAADTLVEMSSEIKKLVEDNDSLVKVFESNDQLKEAIAEAQKYREMNISLNERMNGLVSEKADAIRQVKYWKNEFLKLKKVIGS